MTSSGTIGSKTYAIAFDQERFVEELGVTLIRCGLDPRDQLYATMLKLVADDVQWVIESLAPKAPASDKASDLS